MRSLKSVILLYIVMSSPLIFAETQTTLESILGYRYFQEPFSGYKDTYQDSFFAKFEVSTSKKINQFTLKGKLFGSIDQNDNDRSYADVRQALASYSSGAFTFSGGINTFFWGVSETINLLNTANQSDIKESIDSKVKLGQSFVSASYEFESSLISLFYFPKFVEVQYPVRPMTPFPISASSKFEEGAGEGDYALRWQHIFGWGEGVLGYFYGTRRDPLFIFQPANLSLLPYYIKTQYLSVEGVIFMGDALLKLENKLGKEQNNQFYAHTIGIEYTIYPDFFKVRSVAGIFEIMYDDRDQFAETIGQNDVFVGFKAEIGEFNEFNLRAVFGRDLDFSSNYVDLAFEYRISDYLIFKAKVVQFINVDSEDSRLALIREEDFLQGSFHYAF